MLVLRVFLFATCAWAASYTVNAGGNWNAYKTTLAPGDVLTIRPQTAGVPYTYHLTGANQFVLNGSPGNPIIVQGAAGEDITIQMDACQNVVELKGQYFVFQNLKLTAGSAAPGAIGLRLIPDVNHAVINKITVHDVLETAFTANSYGATYNNVTFSNCEAYNVGGTGECFYVGCQSSGSTVACSFNNGFLINNYCHDTCIPGGCSGGSMGSGYQVKGWGSSGNTVRGNTCVNVAQVCILLYDDFDGGPNIVENNWIYNSIADAGIQVSAGAVIRNNVIVGNQQGIVVTANSANLYPGKQNRNITIVGNTIVNNNGVGIRMATINPVAGTRVANNIVIEDSGVAFNVGSQSGIPWAKNAYSGGAAPAGVVPGGLVTVGASSTIFQNVAGRNFHPKAGTAVLSAGSALFGTDSTTDFSCAARNAATPTIGAYETTTGAALPLGFLPTCTSGGTSPTPQPTFQPTFQPTAPTPACTGINCGAHGSCIEPNPTCVCTGNYTGTRCDVPPPDPCIGAPPQVNCGAHGTCNAGVCTCLGGYTGTLCTTPPAPTCTDGVMNGNEAGIDCGGTACLPCPSYYWNPQPWNNCSLPCGGGTQTRGVQCVNSANGMVTTPDKCQNASHDFATTQPCNVDPCATYSWNFTNWDNCSTPCGPGFQSRTVSCRSSIGDVVVADSFCTGAKPVSQQNCNLAACVAPHWQTGQWSNCTVTCGGGTQARTVTCVDKDANPVANTMCTDVMPAGSQTCNLDTCETYNWYACETFTPCTAQCNGGGAMVGNQFRDVWCRRSSDNTAVDEVLCTATTKPTALLTICNTQPCTNFNWMADSNFGPCTLQPNGLYQRFRTFHCHAASGAVALRSECDANAGKLPIGVLPCTPGTCANPNGCPTVEIADVLNQCESSDRLKKCIVTSPCGVAARTLEKSLESLGFGTRLSAAGECVDTYVTSLSANDKPGADITSYVRTKVVLGQTLCIPAASGASSVVPALLLILATCCLAIA